MVNQELKIAKLNHKMAKENKTLFNEKRMEILGQIVKSNPNWDLKLGVLPN